MYIIQDTIYNTYVAYIDNYISPDCWTVIYNNATKFINLKVAKQYKRYFAKICKIKLKDLKIIKID